MCAHCVVDGVDKACVGVGMRAWYDGTAGGWREWGMVMVIRVGQRHTVHRASAGAVRQRMRVRRWAGRCCKVESQPMPMSACS